MSDLSDVSYNTNTPADSHTVADGDVLYWNATHVGGNVHWMPLGRDQTPIKDSTKYITSGGVFTALEGKAPEPTASGLYAWDDSVNSWLDTKDQIIPMGGINVEINNILTSVTNDIITIAVESQPTFLGVATEHSYVYQYIETTENITHIEFNNNFKNSLQIGAQVVIEIKNTGTSAIEFTPDLKNSGSSIMRKHKTMPASIEIDVDEVLLVTIYKTKDITSNNIKPFYLIADVFA